MRIVKYLVVLAIALCATASASNAQSIQFLGGGSTAIFLELGQASLSIPGVTCVWTTNKTASMVARDTRSGTVDEQGPAWITWTPGSTGTCAAPAGTGINIYSYMSIDSVEGDRCFFETEASGTSGCTQILTVAAGTAGVGLLCSPSPTTCTQFGPDTPIPANIISAINNQHWFAIGTDIRPEDAKFQSLRMFTSCGTSVGRAPFGGGLTTAFGLGYQTGTNGVGTTTQSFYSTAVSHLLDFNITGNDPITGKPVPAYSVNTVGAQPIVVVVSPAGGTGIGAATDINGFTLATFYEGVLGRATDLVGPTTADPITVLVREPLSGTYNTFEYSISNSSQFKDSQDDFNCNGSVVNSNPMNLQGTAGQIASFRRRVVGTGEMVTQLKNATSSDQRMGYFFWSAANASTFTATNGKYLTVNGIDPLQDAYSGAYTGQVAGQLPNATNGFLSHVTFKWLNMGDYPIWSAVRVVSTSPTPAGVTALISGAQTLTSSQNDFITLPNLNVWHSHFALPAINSGVQANGATINPATPNDLCNPTGGAILESGGDAGGSNVLKSGNSDFCHDFNNQNGLINRNN
jgi:ABC-type phosphate transport system substrate-binding protein